MNDSKTDLDQSGVSEKKDSVENLAIEQDSNEEEKEQSTKPPSKIKISLSKRLIGSGSSKRFSMLKQSSKNFGLSGRFKISLLNSKQDEQIDNIVEETEIMDPFLLQAVIHRMKSYQSSGFSKPHRELDNHSRSSLSRILWYDEALSTEEMDIAEFDAASRIQAKVRQIQAVMLFEKLKKERFLERESYESKCFQNSQGIRAISSFSDDIIFDDIEAKGKDTAAQNEDQAACKIQSKFRQLKAKEEYRDLKGKHDAALIIQCKARQNQAKGQKDEKARLRTMEMLACTIIQCKVRQIQAKKLLEEWKYELSKQHAASTVIQSRVRQNKAKQRVEELRSQQQAEEQKNEEVEPAEADRDNVAQQEADAEGPEGKDSAEEPVVKPDDEMPMEEADPEEVEFDSPIEQVDTEESRTIDADNSEQENTDFEESVEAHVQFSMVENEAAAKADAEDPEGKDSSEEPAVEPDDEIPMEEADPEVQSEKPAADHEIVVKQDDPEEVEFDSPIEQVDTEESRTIDANNSKQDDADFEESVEVDVQISMVDKEAAKEEPIEDPAEEANVEDGADYFTAGGEIWQTGNEINEEPEINPEFQKLYNMDKSKKHRKVKINESGTLLPSIHKQPRQSRRVCGKKAKMITSKSLDDGVTRFPPIKPKRPQRRHSDGQPQRMGRSYRSSQGELLAMSYQASQGDLLESSWNSTLDSSVATSKIVSRKLNKDSSEKSVYYARTIKKMDREKNKVQRKKQKATTKAQRQKEYAEQIRQQQRKKLQQRSMTLKAEVNEK